MLTAYCLAAVVTLAQTPVEKRFVFEAARPDPELTVTEAQRDAAKFVFRRPGASTVSVRFFVPTLPTGATLELEHLSSMASQAPHGGTSIIAVRVNGAVAVREWDIGSHGFVTDRLHIGKFIKTGHNTIDIAMVGGATGYWLRRVEVRCTLPAGTSLDGKAERIGGSADTTYAVVVSRRTYRDAAWRKVVDALVGKHAAAVVICPNSVLEARDELAALHPRYACFVAQPDEIGRDVVVELNRMTRRLDADPYSDVRWGILTGYDAADALRIAERREPLLIRRVAGGTGIDLDRFESGAWFSEGEKNVKWVKQKGTPAAKAACGDDATAEIVAELVNGRPDLFLTSGHATERDWQIGYSFKAGQFRCEQGKLFGLDLAGKRYPIESPNPKVYLAAGNCRMGLIPDGDAMALAWMHSGGAHQVVGYSVSTIVSSTGGWATTDYFVTAGMPLADAFFAAQQWIVHQLETRFPTLARVELDNFDIETNPQLVQSLAQRFGIRDREQLVLLWDRDVLALYGDPAWIARPAEPRPPFEITVAETSGTWTVEATTLSDGGWARAPFAFLPTALKDVKLLEGDALVTDDFVLQPLPAAATKGQKARSVFKASPR